MPTDQTLYNGVCRKSVPRVGINKKHLLMNDSIKETMKEKKFIIPVMLLVISTFALIALISYVGGGSPSNTSEQSSMQATTNVYDEEIDKLEALVNDIVRLEYQYMETRDETIAERGEEKCTQLRALSYKLEQYQQAGKLSVEQMDRINHILEKLPQ